MDGDFRIARWKGPRSLLNQRVCRLRVVKQQDYDTRFLEYVLPGYLDAIHERTSSVTVKHLSSRTIGEIPVPRPSLGEQERIVETIEEQFSRLDAAVESLQRAKRNLTRLRAAALGAAVDGRLRAGSQEESTRTGLLSENASGTAGRLPVGWRLVPLGSLASMSLGKMLDRKRQTGLDPVPYLRNVNVRWFGFDLSDLAVMDVAPFEFQRVSVLAGDLVVCEGGEPGRCAVWRGGPMAIQKALHRVRPADGVMADYLAIVLRWWADRPEMDRFITGTTIKHVPKEKLQLLPIPLPPSNEQGRIVTEVERLFSIIDAMGQAIDSGPKRAGVLRQATLSRAFTGRLRVST